MKIWIINPYGNIPGEGWRTYRTTLIANAFVENGHQVVSWVSNIQHRSKERRAETWKDVQVNPNYLIKIVPSVPYSSHISFARIQYERTYAKNLRERALGLGEWRNAHLDEPDLIILAEPALFLSDIILDVVKQKKCKLLVDIIDLWPELFSILLPKRFTFIDKILFFPLYYRRRQLLKKADGIIAVAKDYLKLALKANPQVPNDVVYWGLEVSEVKSLTSNAFVSPLLQQLQKQENEIWVVYAGTLGPNYDIKTIVACAKLLAKTAPHVKIIVAGDGPLRNLVSHSQANLIYVGSLTSADVSLLYTKCDMALSSYVGASTVSMPIKAYDYLASGLPLINSLGRDLGTFVVQEVVGLPYLAEDVNSMAASILTLATDSELRHKMGGNALALSDQFDAKIQYQKVVQVAEQIWHLV
ncbi:glycosyltransferase [Pedobacter sp. Du54]|uniref:glycosyltransferase n=1 Tax=Pedobacter anseongensis TaxID=3133439 RepID=UPI00309D575E